MNEEPGALRRAAEESTRRPPALTAGLTLWCSMLTACALAWGCGGIQETEGARQEADGSWSYVYTLPANSSSLYPDKSWLPAPYDESYPDLAATIREFTEQSLTLSGIAGGNVKSVSLAAAKPLIVIGGDDPAALNDFAVMHQAFLDSTHAPQGLNGVNLCKSVSGCWDPQPIQDQPWAFFLPLGLPLTNQVAVSYLNFPPDDSLTDANYLNNFTMKRWYDVLQSAGIADPYLYETIVDARPIAAAGSQGSEMPEISTYFNASGTDNYYNTPMIELLTNPPTNPSASSLPVIVLGTPSREAWATIVGQPVDILGVGTSTLPGASKPTSWIASNHPDVTTYQCCPGDPSSGCTNPGYPPAYDLIPDEKIDLQAACIILGLAEDPAADPIAIKTACAAEWDTSPSVANQQTICVRAKLDYDFTTQGQCKSQSAAEAFCSYYQNNACPTDVYSCDFE